jgi:hypothetical protein
MPVSRIAFADRPLEAGAEQQVMVPLQRLAIAASVRDEKVAAVEAAGPRRDERR